MREEREAGTEEPARHQAASQKCRPRRGGEAREESRGERGGGDPGPRGEIPGSRATSRGRAGRPGPRLASCPRPRHPASRLRGGAPASPAPTWRPRRASFPRTPSRWVFTRPGAGARRLRAGPAYSASRWELGGVGLWGAGRGAGRRRTLRDVQVDAGLSPEARCWAKGRRAPR